MQTLGLKVPSQDILRAHKHCFKNRAEIEASEICGCFYCLEVYPPTDINNWTDDNQTAICKCLIDSVIGSASGFPITREFLQRMHDHWF